MKITLDSSALKTLLELNPELTVQISQAVACSFAERYLKPLARDPQIQAAISLSKEATTKAVREAVHQHFGCLHPEQWNRPAYVTLKPEFLAELKGKTDARFQELVAEAFQEAIVPFTEEAIKSHVSTISEREINRRIEDAVGARLAEIRARL